MAPITISTATTCKMFHRVFISGREVEVRNNNKEELHLTAGLSFRCIEHAIVYPCHLLSLPTITTNSGDPRSLAASFSPILF